MSKAEEIHYKAVMAADNQKPPKDYVISAHADHFNGFVEGYVEGYSQAEKELDISWVKEVSGVKEMKRAEEEALKAYPPRSIAANYDTINRRDAFEFGYLKAEKDLELTIEDIERIHTFLYAIKHNKQGVFTFTRLSDEQYQEVLKRFKSYGKKEI